jgi:ATP-binding cassette subfamily F protein 2
MAPISASKAARLAKKAEKGDKPEKKTAASRLSSKAGSKNASTNGSKASSVAGDDDGPLLDEDEEDAPATTADKMDKVKKLTEQMDKHGLSDRVTTGVLASQESSRDVKITSCSLVFHGKVLISDSTLEINYGRRYGLLGENGCGKSTLLKAIDKREYPFPEHVDIYLLNEGAPLTELGALEWVVKEAEKEVQRLDDLAEEILERDGPESPQLMEIYEVRKTNPDKKVPSDHRNSVPKPWIPARSKFEPPSFSPVSASTRRPSTKRPRTCPVVGECVWPSAGLSSSSRPSCCSTTRPPIWTWKPVCGWKST